MASLTLRSLTRATTSLSASSVLATHGTNTVSRLHQSVRLKNTVPQSFRHLSVSSPRHNDTLPKPLGPPEGESSSPSLQSKLSFKPHEPRLSMTMTCTVTDCGTRSTHEFSKRSYEKGIVLVQCPGCNNRHLIADHLGWFKDSTDGGSLRTVEDFMRAKGEQAKWGYIDEGGDIQIIPKDES